MSYIKDLVTLIIPCYNGLNFIDANFQSILEQTYKKVEIIFVDDGSTDGSFEKAVAYTEDFAREGMELICIRKENGGAASAVQEAFQKTRGEFFQLCDVDDIIYPENIKSKYQYLKEHADCAFVRNEGEIFNIEKDVVVSIFSVRKQEKRTYNLFRDLILGKTWNWSGSFLIRTELFFHVNQGKDIYLSKYGQNMQVLLPMAYRFKCGYVSQILSRYNEYPISVSHNDDYEKGIQLLDGYRDIRINVLKHMNITDKKLLKQIDQYYIKKKLDLAMQRRKEEEIKKYYKQIKKTPKNILLIFSYKFKIFKKVYINIAKLLKRN